METYEETVYEDKPLRVGEELHYPPGSHAVIGDDRRILFVGAESDCRTALAAVAVEHSDPFLARWAGDAFVRVSG